MYTISLNTNTNNWKIFKYNSKHHDKKEKKNILYKTFYLFPFEKYCIDRFVKLKISCWGHFSAVQRIPPRRHSLRLWKMVSSAFGLAVVEDDDTFSPLVPLNRSLRNPLVQIISNVDSSTPTTLSISGNGQGPGLFSSWHWPMKRTWFSRGHGLCTHRGITSFFGRIRYSLCLHGPRLYAS